MAAHSSILAWKIPRTEEPGGLQTWLSKWLHKQQSCKSSGKPVCMCAKTLQSCLALCDPMDWSPRGSSVHGILQARILEWIATSSSGGSSPPRIKPVSPCLLFWQAVSLPLVPPGFLKKPIPRQTFTEIIYSGHEMTQRFSFKSRLTRIKDRTHLSSSTRNFKNKRNQEPEVN